jgi:hypothetical protein
MSKKRVPHEQSPAKNVRRGLSKTMLIVLAVCVVAAGAALSRWEPVRRSLGLSSTLTSAPPQAGNLNLAKEYIYSGGRLVATEEPTNSSLPAGPPPTNLVATATSATSVTLTWTPPATGTVTNYVVERRQNVNSPYTALTPNPTSNAFPDNTAVGGIAYLYRVRASFSDGGVSDNSNVDMATTLTFTDDPLTVGVTPIKAGHLSEMRQAVNAVRLTAGLSPANWTDASLVGAAIKAVHVQELRSNLDPALSLLGFTILPYTDPSLQGVAVKKVHLEELRNRVK